MLFHLGRVYGNLMSRFWKKKTFGLLGDVASISFLPCRSGGRWVRVGSRILRSVTVLDGLGLLRSSSKAARHLKSRVDKGLLSCLKAYRSVLDRLSSLDSTPLYNLCFYTTMDTGIKVYLRIHSRLFFCSYIYIYIYDIALWCKNQIEHSIWDESLLLSNCARSLEYSSSSTLVGLSYHICGKLEVAFKASPSSQHQHCTDEAQKAATV